MTTPDDLAGQLGALTEQLHELRADQRATAGAIGDVLAEILLVVSRLEERQK